MASGSSSAFSFRNQCVSCGKLGYWTPRIWKCDVCQDYLLCESCYAHGFCLEDCEKESSPPQAHNQDHGMSPHVTNFACDGCDAYPIWNQRWRCTKCDSFDLCEACYRVALDASDMAFGHPKEHPMIAVEVMSSASYKAQSNFNNPADPRWTYLLEGDVSRGGFLWIQKKSLAGKFGDENVIQIPPETKYEDSSSHLSNLEKEISLSYKSSSLMPTSETIPLQGDLDKKHKIFLSHAGAEKDFVEQLNFDLSRVHHYGTFFDKDDESLPKGEPFPERIFDAAMHCQLAIVVLSNDYFMRKWPMLELVKFVEAQKVRPELKILPVFYKLTVEEFKQPVRQQSFVKCWNGWLRSSMSKHDDIQQWKEALKVISRTNGIEYDKSMGEVALRENIVETVYKRVKPALLWDDAHVQGKTRMHDMIQEKIQISKNGTNRVQLSHTSYIGLYGMGGSGKTTMCKVFCNEMMQVYVGKVCLIEFGSMDVLQLHKKLLQNIGYFDSGFLSIIDEGQALNLLRNHLPMYKICLVIDNVSDDQASIEEARTLKNLPFKGGSLILVTSRSAIILEKLKIKREAMMKIPTLNANEARALFSHHTGCDTTNLSNDQNRAMDMFVEECNFKVEGTTTSQEYHPLALKVLGTRVGPNPEEWENVIIDYKYYGSESKYNIFSILRTSYDALNPRYQRMFLDIALSRSNSIASISGLYMKWQMRLLHGQKEERFIPDHLVKLLEAKSLIDSYDVHSQEIYIHDLYREFAKMEVENRGLQHSPRCCFSRAMIRQHVIQEGRLRIQNQLNISHVTKADILSCTICSNAELITIEGCANLKSVDVPDMPNLRIFEVPGGCPRLTNVNLEGATNLQYLSWDGFQGDFPDLNKFDLLEGLWLLNREEEPSPPRKGCLDFSRSANLYSLLLSYLPLQLSNLNQAVQLKHVLVRDCQYLERFEGLESLANLEYINLQVCSSLVEFPSLANFPCLKYFHLTGAAKLREIQGFASLTALIQLRLNGGRELENLPGIEACTRLASLELSDTNIVDVSWISAMKDLQFIHLSGTMIRSVPECSELRKLSELWLRNCEALESQVSSNFGSPPSLPQNLQVFNAENSRNLKVLPLINHQSSLKDLRITGTSVDDMSGVLNCVELQRLFCAKTRITTLPDLSSLRSLKVLDVGGCELLTRMDNIKSLPALQLLVVEGCTTLLALPDLRSSKELIGFSLANCPLVDPNSVLLPADESTVDDEMEMVDPAEEDQSHSGVQRIGSQNQTVVSATDSLQPQPLQRSGTLFDLVASWFSAGLRP